MTTTTSPGIDFLSPRELAGILGDLHQGESFVDKAFTATPTSVGNGIIKKATTPRFGLPQLDPRIQAGDTVQRGPGATFDDVPFECQEFAHEEPTPWISARRAAEYIPLFAYNAQITRDICQTKRDVVVATDLIAASWVSTTSPGDGDRWMQATAKPHNQLVALKRTIKGAKPNLLLMGQDVWAAYMTNASVLDSMNVNADHALADEDFFMQAVARKLGIARLVVVDSYYNTSQTLASQTLADIFAGTVWMGVVNTAPGLASPSGRVAGLEATAVARIVEEPLTTREYDEDTTRSRVAQSHMSEVTKVADTRLGAMLTSVLG